MPQRALHATPMNYMSLTRAVSLERSTVVILLKKASIWLQHRHSSTGGPMRYSTDATMVSYKLVGSCVQTCVHG